MAAVLTACPVPRKVCEGCSAACPILLPVAFAAVSYTHLDVYKRQNQPSGKEQLNAHDKERCHPAEELVAE